MINTNEKAPEEEMKNLNRLFDKDTEYKVFMVM
jgi:hypothetical protein